MRTDEGGAARATPDFIIVRAEQGCTHQADGAVHGVSACYACLVGSMERADAEQSHLVEQYEPKTDEEKLGYLVEECGEVLAATGKTLRWGLDSANPELPPAERETNRDWLKRELKDLRRAIRYVEKVVGV